MKQHFSTPIWVYLLIAVCTILLFLLAYISPMNWSSLFKNVGYSLIASMIAALLIDLGTTKIQRTRQQEQYEILIAECKRRCRALVDSVVEAADMRGEKFDNDTFDFSTWGQKALAPNKEGLTEDHYWNVLFEVAYPVTKIRESAAQLYESSMYFLDNENFSVQFRRDLNNLVSMCRYIERIFDHENFDQFSKAVTLRFPKSIIGVFPDLADDFTRKYPAPNHDDEEEG